VVDDAAGRVDDTAGKACDIFDGNSWSAVVRNVTAVGDAASEHRRARDDNAKAPRRDRAAVADAAREGGNGPHEDAVVMVSRREEAGIADAAAERVRVFHGDGGCGAAIGDDFAAAVDLYTADDDAAIENAAAAEEGAADDRNAAGADRAGIGDATAEGSVADHHRGRVAAKDGRIRPIECHWRPPKALLRRDAACRSRSPALLRCGSLIEASRAVQSRFPKAC
jgi:hypothetical protein